MKEHILLAKDTSTVRKLISSNNSSMTNSSQYFEEYIVDLKTRTTYVKKKFLGKGGFARCYELLDLTSNKVYACKIIPKCFITSPIHKEKIVREVDLHSSLNHPHVVEFHHYFEDKDNVYILLENCPKKSLVHVLKHRCVLTEPEVRYYMKQLVEGVKYIHNQRVIHRDLKLGNMFLTENMQMKIGDFGLATKLEKDGDQKITVCGTPNYIAPEVLNKLGHSFQADIWALGCIMYAMLVGKPPFETASLKDTYNRITNNKYCLPASLSQSAQDLIVELLEPNPKLRPSLDAILQHEFFKGFCPTCLSPSSYDTEPEFKEDSDIMRIATSLSQVKLGSKLSERPKIINNGKSHKLRLKESVKETMNPVINTVLKQAVNSFLQSDNKGKTKEAAKISRRKCIIYESLCLCLDTMPESSVNPPSVVCKDMVYVTKWIDYSNKYGFGFQLSDQNVSVLFNDSSKMNLGTDKRTIHYYDLKNQLIQFCVGEVPPGLAKITMLLQYFAQYMDENLIEGGDLEVPLDANNNKSDIPFMRRWFRTSKAIVMLLSNETIQVNFFHDHTKIILSPIIAKDDTYVTYINEERLSTTFLMSELKVFGCCRIIRQRLCYLQSILKGLPEIDC